MDKKITPGSYYLLDKGLLTAIDGAPPTPATVWICQRLADWPDGNAPAGSGRAECTRCGEPISFDPALRDRHPKASQVCIQCAVDHPGVS